MRMVPEPVAITNHDLYHVCLTGITYNDCLTDQCENSCSGAVTVAPREQIFVDTLGPVAETTLEPDGSGSIDRSSRDGQLLLLPVQRQG